MPESKPISEENLKELQDKISLQDDQIKELIEKGEKDAGIMSKFMSTFKKKAKEEKPKEEEEEEGEEDEKGEKEEEKPKKKAKDKDSSVDKSLKQLQKDNELMKLKLKEIETSKALDFLYKEHEIKTQEEKDYFVYQLAQAESKLEDDEELSEEKVEEIAEKTLKLFNKEGEEDDNDTKKADKKGKATSIDKKRKAVTGGKTLPTFEQFQKMNIFDKNTFCKENPEEYDKYRDKADEEAGFEVWENLN